LSLWKKCRNKTTEENCKYHLVDSPTPYYLIENVSYIEESAEYINISNGTHWRLEQHLVNKTFYEITNITIKSINLQVEEEQDKQIERTKGLRDKANYNELGELYDLI
jgi:aspartyl aminopeptidase